MADYKRYINALRKCAKEHENDRTSTGHIIVSDLCRDTANLLETLEQEPKTGHWIVEDMFDGDVAYRCSACNELFCIIEGTPKDNEYNYCPNCGVKMVEPQESEDKQEGNSFTDKCFVKWGENYVEVKRATMGFVTIEEY